MDPSAKILEILSRTFAAETADSFFTSLTSRVCEALEADFAWTGEFDPETGTVTTVAVHAAGKVAPNFTYPLEGTPCEHVVAHQLCYFPERAWERFPGDQWLADEGIECYMGSPLWDAKGNPLGIQVVVSRKPLPDPHLAQSLLNAVAARTAAEFERRRRETALRESEERFRSLFETAAIGIAVVDVNARPIATNPALSAMLGYDASELHELTFSRFTHPDDVTRAAALFDELVAGGRDRYQIDKRYIRRDGSIMWGRQTGSVLRDALGCPRFIVNMIEDVTDRQIAAERLEAMRRLEEDIQRGEQQAALGRVAASMAHEFNNVLMGIQPFAQMLARSDNPPRTAQALDHIQKAVRRGKHVAAEVLRFTRNEPVALERTGICTCIRQIAEEIASICPESVEFRTSIPGKEWYVLANADQLQQVIVNLAKNSLHAMPEGGSLSIEVTTDASGSHPAAPNGTVWITVADTGAGISPAHLDHIFEPLFTTRRGGEGTGLGLSVAAQIVRHHQGTLTVESELGRGTKFRLHLPVAAPPEDAATPQMDRSEVILE